MPPNVAAAGASDKRPRRVHLGHIHETNRAREM
jgi:phosphoribosyl 1,2-cyclic phosphodiesterase